ncbi:15582_t:CDS:1, partial [Racocetra persica]
MDSYFCHLCPPNLRYPYRSQSSLVKHEKAKHPTNTIIPHIYTITAPSNYDIEQFRNTFIIQVKKWLQFGHNAVKDKTIRLEPFSEGLFVVLFYRIPTFSFTVSQKKYTVSFKGSKGYDELENLLKDNKWGSKQDRSGTTAYVLMENESEIYE